MCMLRAVILFFMFCFFLWILPLGVFISPANEKMACDGQRAICLCSHAQSTVKGNSMEGFGLKTISGGHKEEASSGGGSGHPYLAAHLPAQDA